MEDYTIERNGREYRVTIEYDNDMRAPWEECDGHGVVSEWTTRDKRPGERVLCTSGRSRRYYDVQESIAIAKRDCWGPKVGTKGETAAKAVDADFEYLHRWCTNDWYYVVVGVEDVESGETEYLGGVEYDWREKYHEEIIEQLIDEHEARIEEETKQARIANRFRDAMECGL